MKILFTGGGTGGHFYPIIAVAQSVNEIIEQEKLVGVKLYFMSDAPYDKRLLFENNIEFKYAPAGKLRKYFSIWNFTDSIKTFFGILSAIWKMYLLYPDVVFGKGGYASFPALVAARFWGIPIFLHESDSIPGRVNLIAGKWGATKRIAVSYPDAASYFPEEKVAVTGNPIRKELVDSIKTGSAEYFGLRNDKPIIFITGGSLGARNINDIIVDNLPELLKNYQIIHQTGGANFKEVTNRANLIIEKDPNKEGYKPLAHLDETAMKMAGGASSLVISRAGSAIFEIANWGLPSIIIPIPEDVSRDQHKNAFAYARRSKAVVLEEKNLSGTILLSEINRILKNPALIEEMKQGALSFSSKGAADKIAREIVNIGLEHEK